MKQTLLRKKIFQNQLAIEEKLLFPVIVNDNFQAPTEMEVDSNQQNYGNPNEIRPIGIKNANKVSIFNRK